VQAQSRHRAGNAFAAYGRDLYGVSVFQNDEQRNHPAQGEDDLIDFVTNLKKHILLGHRNDGEMSVQAFEIGMR
jgi:hypothetical protein